MLTGTQPHAMKFTNIILNYMFKLCHNAMTEDEMAGWHHQLNGHEFEQILGDGEGQGSLACCSPWATKSRT